MVLQVPDSYFQTYDNRKMITLHRAFVFIFEPEFDDRLHAQNELDDNNFSFETEAVRIESDDYSFHPLSNT